MELTFTRRWLGLHPDVHVLDAEGKEIYLFRGRWFAFLNRRYEMYDADGNHLVSVQEAFRFVNSEFVISREGRLVCKAGLKNVVRHFAYVDPVGSPRLEITFSGWTGLPKEIRASGKAVGEVRWKWDLKVTIKDEHGTPVNVAGLCAIYVILTTNG